MRRDIYQEYTTWTPADANDLDFYFRPVPDDMILEITSPGLFAPNITKTQVVCFGIDNHGQYLPYGSNLFTTTYKGGYVLQGETQFLLYEHQRLQYKFLAVDAGVLYYFCLHGILYDAQEWKKGKD